LKFNKLNAFVCFAFLLLQPVLGQGNTPTLNQSQETFTIRGSVREKYSYKPIDRVNIEINGGAYAVTGKDGEFRVKVKLGDQLVVRHKDFQTVYHTINSKDRIIIEVEPETLTTSKNGRFKKRVQDFNQLIDSADTYLQTDAERSIQFIADALNQSSSQRQNAEAYEILGDLYMFLKQYDLAVTNYRISLQNADQSNIQLKLAKAFAAIKNYQESITTYQAIEVRELSNYEKIDYYESLGDVYVKITKTSEAITNYEKGLQVAQNAKITSKITDLNSKLAQAYGADGNEDKARSLFDTALNFAASESKKRTVQEKVTVAEFNNETADYDAEISLRKEVVEAVKDIETDSIIPNESPLTPQKQNYKIANALMLQNNYSEALPYLSKSIEEAEQRGDLEVKNDALRKKADAYENIGDFEKAKAEFQKYMASVDQLYIKKEQDIANAARLTRNLIENQNRINSLENERLLNKTRYDLSLERNRNQSIIIYSLIGGLVLLLIAIYFTLKYNKQQRLANNLLALKSLRSQMNPHFIFNALNSVNSFIATNDERTANKYLSDFSFLMRAVLENSDQDFIPLEKEIELLELYTKLEHFRFKDKFDYTISVNKNVAINEYDIPPMLLQPYIENAVWHGLRYKTEKGQLLIDISPKSDDEITILIADDGIGRTRSKALKTSNQKKHQSKGMSNIKKRINILNDMYKDKVDVSIDDYQDADDVGTKVLVTLKKD